MVKEKEHDTVMPQPQCKNLVQDWARYCISDWNQDDTSLIHCNLLLSRFVRHSVNAKYFKQICGYLVLRKQVLETSSCNVRPWHVNYRQHPAVNCINLWHKTERFISNPAEDRVCASITASGDAEAGCSPSSGKRPGGRTYRTKNLSYNLCFFSV